VPHCSATVPSAANPAKTNADRCRARATTAPPRGPVEARAMPAQPVTRANRSRPQTRRITMVPSMMATRRARRMRVTTTERHHVAKECRAMAIASCTTANGTATATASKAAACKTASSAAKRVRAAGRLMSAAGADPRRRRWLDSAPRWRGKRRREAAPVTPNANRRERP
jgi:hypothetical protein